MMRQKPMFMPLTSGNSCSFLSHFRAERAETLSPFSRHTATACSGRNNRGRWMEDNADV